MLAGGCGDPSQPGFGGPQQILPLAGALLAQSGVEAYQDLHAYIPILTVKEFLTETGKGYGRWRYLLLEGTRGVPKTHIGAMLEIARACVMILENELFNRNDLQTVEERIKWALNQAIFHEAHAYADYQREQNPDSADFQIVSRKPFMTGKQQGWNDALDVVLRAFNEVAWQKGLGQERKRVAVAMEKHVEGKRRKGSADYRRAMGEIVTPFCRMLKGELYSGSPRTGRACRIRAEQAQPGLPARPGCNVFCAGSFQGG